MEFLEWFMPTVWFVILALFLLLYVILDGFDLGVGILSLTSPSESQRTILMTSLGNVWDANETWLVLMGGALLITFTAPFASEALRQRLFDPAFLPFFVVLPLLGVALIVQLFRSLAMQQEAWPFVYTVLLFILSFAGLGVMVFPAVIPPSVTIFQASSSVSSMVFMLTFIGVLIPIMLFYNIYNYIAFRGKVSAE